MSDNEQKINNDESSDDVFSNLVDRYYRRLVDVDSEPYLHLAGGEESIDEKISEEEREKQLRNDGLAQDTRLKKYTLIILFCFLALETVAIFTIAFFQGFMFKFFYIEEWSFRVLVVSTILQITAMLTIAVKHLFPSK